MVEAINNLEQTLLTDTESKDLEASKETDEMQEAGEELDNSINGYDKLNEDIKARVKRCKETGELDLS
jgi:hypothetical protein